MDKVIVDGKVAVLVSGGFGAGWSTWQNDDESNASMAFEPTIVEMVLAGEKDKNRAQREETMYKLEAYMSETYPDYYTGGLDGIDVKWVPVGTRFIIDEYDGNESLVLESDMNWFTA